MIGCLILIPRYGITGAACSTTASITLVNLVKLVQVRFLFGINPFRAETLRALAAGLVAVGAAAPIVLLVDWPSALAEVAAATLIVLPLYAVVFWVSARS